MEFRRIVTLLKEGAAELIYAISKLERATVPGYYEADTTPEDARDNLIQAVANCQNALDSLIYRLGLNKSAIQQKIEEADDRRAKYLYGRKLWKEYIMEYSLLYGIMMCMLIFIVILWIYVNENRLDIDKSKHEIETLYLYINEMKRDNHD